MTSTGPRPKALSSGRQEDPVDGSLSRYVTRQMMNTGVGGEIEASEARVTAANTELMLDQWDRIIDRMPNDQVGQKIGLGMIGAFGDCVIARQRRRMLGDD